MKKFGKIFLLVVLVLALSLSFVACNNTPVKNGKAEGVGTNSWHVNETFIVYATVTVVNNKVTEIKIDDTKSYYMTDVVIKEWVSGKESYIKKFIGLTVDQVLSIKVTNTQDVNNHFDGGKIESDLVSAVTGATSSSVTVALAIQSAVRKI